MMQPMPTPSDDAPGGTDVQSAEARLAATRNRLRTSIRPRPSAQRSGAQDAIDLFQQVVQPATREIVRRHPVRSLAGAALAGALLVRARPLGGLLGSVISAVLVRQLAEASTRWLADPTGHPTDGERAE